VNSEASCVDLFRDTDVERVRAAGGEADLGLWRVRLPEVFGFCGGVLNALRLLNHAVETRPAGSTIRLLGEVIHNDTVNRYFRERGVRILGPEEVRNVFSDAVAGDTVVIPAFGISREIEEDLLTCPGRDCRVLDTTCGCVKEVWRFVAAAAAGGRTVVLHGKPGHPETRSTLSRALTDRNTVIVVPDLEHARVLADALANGSPGSYPVELVHNPDALAPRHLAVANQTTMLCSETLAVERLLSQSLGGLEIPSHAVCRATERRQAAARSLCESGCDLILVIGGYRSSNTAQLYRLAAAYAPTYFVRDAAALARDRLESYDPLTGRVQERTGWRPGPGAVIGILAGASCPTSDVGDVIRFLQRIGSAEERNG
jgi:4-hydroxy-3-methylbut-2-enyl diphosphate reductase